MNARVFLVPLLCLALPACHIFGRLGEVGREQRLSAVDSKDYQPVNLPMPDPQAREGYRNSLWKYGARAFFKDQRAAQVGDILTVRVVIAENASFSNQTKTSRSLDTEKMGINALGGYENYVAKVMPGGFNPTNILDLSSSTANSGAGSISRNESLSMTMAAIVTQVMPNGNLVVNGSQEVKVNNEMRLLSLSGVIRRADILADNTIRSDKIAELRLAYGGRGAVQDAQRQRWGQQIVDTIAPF